MFQVDETAITCRRRGQPEWWVLSSRSETRRTAGTRRRCKPAPLHCAPSSAALCPSRCHPGTEEIDDFSTSIRWQNPDSRHKVFEKPSSMTLQTSAKPTDHSMAPLMKDSGNLSTTKDSGNLSSRLCVEMKLKLSSHQREAVVRSVR